ncbi:phytanoyl-CoA dioxygenase PhyH [Kribbella voronezhensis]|uniref:Phytanoyl-CoA dioxygenase PhyH n=1 Tax=Kribbella voronezhensis TaxID=2512212 RepID=A0A4R7TCT8_9ACTN|nr:phytanoyl-CoA dioxygenase family protein [Kribbella voronezhensis]TDU89930.1 phytanoyl-CoA dioxygenase PhyH [Kribbella voronezhensis]
MWDEGVVEEWRARGFVVLPGFLSGEELAPAIGELGRMFPTAEGFHDGTDERRGRYVEDEFDGIDVFPFGSTEFSLLAVHPRIVELAEKLLGRTELRLSSAEAWAKYTGATSYEQELHRDYLNQTILVPSTEDRYQQLELFVFLGDVPEELGPPHLVAYEHTAELPMKPNFYPRSGGSGDFVSTEDNARLYDAEESGSAPAGTVIAFNTRTFHRGTGLRKPRGARYSMQLIYRPAEADWGQRVGWAARSHEPAWYEFVHRATPRQLELFGFPPPGHPFWNDETLTGISQRYPELDTTPWQTAAE